ncbi:MAG: ABC transporter permease [Thermodesulfovibrionales bacterium]|jgi:putative ABC transport system permease protein|nr:ABC transporter permease [Thermodesulfovibrionales bacterium]
MDRLIKIISQSIMAVRAFKLRTFFCLISVALGIASITVIVAATEGAYKKALDIVARFGPDSLLIFGGSEEARAIGQRQKTLTLDDIEAVREAFSSAYLVVPQTSVGNTNVSYKDKKYQTQVIGSTSDYSRIWTWPVIQGSDFTEDDVKGLRNVGLVGQHLLKELFGKEDPVGKYILVKGIPVQIVGVLSERGTSPSGHNLDDRIILPLTTVMRKLQNETKYVSAFRIRFLDQENLYIHAEELRSFLRQRHKILDDEPDDFRIVSPKEIVKFLVALTGSLVIFLGVTGLISLVVAGFVLANLFLLSVKERTTEIGIRRAAGAKKRDILMQFLGESVIITTIGGLFGFLLGLLSSKLLMLIAQFPIHFSWKAFAIGLFLSWAVGIGFGLQPANRAANLKPIEAIRG